MNTTKSIRITLFLCALTISSALNAQVYQLNNNIVTTQPYIGCDAGSTQPLRFSTLANYRHEWRTNNLLRAVLNQDVTYPTLGVATNVNANGYYGLSGDQTFFSGTPGPFSRLHLAHSITGQNTSTLGYRTWMQNGITFTGNN
jgi:hypothetical protein